MIWNWGAGKCRRRPCSGADGFVWRANGGPRVPADDAARARAGRAIVWALSAPLQPQPVGRKIGLESARLRGAPFPRPNPGAHLKGSSEILISNAFASCCRRRLSPPPTATLPASLLLFTNSIFTPERRRKSAGALVGSAAASLAPQESSLALSALLECHFSGPRRCVTFSH